MKSRLALALVAGLFAAPALADTTIVNENFDGYADDAAFQSVWGPTTGLGTAAALPADVSSGILTTDATTFPNIQGKAVDHIGASASTPGMVNQFGGVIDQTTAVEPDFTINPSSTQKVVLSADIFFANNGNERMTVGLRSITATPDGSDADTFPDANTVNILEMGQWNAAPTVTTVPGAPQVVTAFAYRLINFGAVSAPIAVQPNWQFFTLAPELDRTTDADTVTSLADIGAGWHRYQATISETQITLSIDLFRDGKTNLTRDVNGAIEIGVGADGVDASITYDVITLGQGFNALRIGGPSGLLSGGIGASAFDNISLILKDNVVVPPNTPDFNSDGTVDGADLLIWQKGLGINDGTALQADGDATGDGNVTAADLAAWQAKFGGPPAVAAAGAVPEPTAALLALAGLVALAAKNRNLQA